MKLQSARILNSNVRCAAAFNQLCDYSFLSYIQCIIKLEHTRVAIQLIKIKVLGQKEEFAKVRLYVISSKLVLRVSLNVDLVVFQAYFFLLIFLEVSDQIGSILGFFQSGKHHFGAGNIFLRILEILVQVALGPGNTLLDIGIGVFVSGGSATFATHDTAQIGAHLVLATRFSGVALSTLLNEDLFSIFGIRTHLERLKKKENFNINC